MGALGVLLVVGVVLTARWGGTPYRPWEPAGGGDASARSATLRYLRGVGVALVGGFWAGALVTGPAMRLIMRLLAAAAGDGAQGVITEAEEVVGEITAEGTVGLIVFGGILPGLMSGLLYVLLRRWLPQGRLGGLVFGILHLLLGATRIDPLRPGNVDFDIVGPGWLSVVTFGLAAVVHGMAVVAIANRFSARFPPALGGRRERVRAAAPLVVPALMLVPAGAIVLPLLVGLVVSVLASRVGGMAAALRSRQALVAGRVALAGVALAFLPATVLDLRDIILR